MHPKRQQQVFKLFYYGNSRAFIVRELQQFCVKAGISQWDMPAFMVKDVMDLAYNAVRIVYNETVETERENCFRSWEAVLITVLWGFCIIYSLHRFSCLQSPLLATKLFLLNQGHSRITIFFNIIILLAVKAWQLLCMVW